jgi:hypothetical protein
MITLLPDRKAPALSAERLLRESRLLEEAAKVK